MNDILNNKLLKSMPYDIPEGYFENLRNSLEPKTSKLTRKWPAYMALAAAFALLIAAGGFFLGRFSVSEDFTEEDYIVFSEDMTNAILYEEDSQYAEAVSEDDIIEYLIYAGTEIEELY